MSRNSTIHVDLDQLTAQKLVRLAAKWGVTQEEALRRALETADAQVEQVKDENRLEILRELQQRLELTPAQADAWEAAVRNARQ